MAIELAILALLAFLAELALHYVCRFWFEDVKPPWSYVAGLLPLMAILTAWVLLRPGHSAAQVLVAAWVLVAAGGVAVLGAHLADWVHRLTMTLWVERSRNGSNDE